MNDDVHCPSALDQREDIEITVVVPAFNEVVRAPPFLKAIEEYMDSEFRGAYEVIVVDDGGTDGLDEWVARRSRVWPQLRLLRHEVNRGKGAAVRSGMLASCGKLLLFADADGAAPIEEEKKLRQAIERGADLAIGSRFISASQSRRSPSRRIGGIVFRKCVQALARVSVSDSQCGFKMFRRPVGLRLFENCDEAGYLFDVLILRVARILGYSVADVGIHWAEQPGSKVRPLRDFLSMASGLWAIPRRATHIVRMDGVQDIPEPKHRLHTDVAVKYESGNR